MSTNKQIRISDLTQSEIDELEKLYSCEKGNYILGREVVTDFEPEFKAFIETIRQLHKNA